MPDTLTVLWDRSVFYITLLVTISLGCFYKKIDNMEMKRNYGAGLGLLIICLVSGNKLYHTIIMVWGNVVILKCCDRKYIHFLSLAYTWLYIIFFHYNYPGQDHLIWIHRSIALRVVGLAYEIVISDMAKDSLKRRHNKDKNTEGAESIEPTIDNTETPIATLSKPGVADDYNDDVQFGYSKTLTEMDVLTSDPSPYDIITYAFYFIGIHKGPYYRYRLFKDHFEEPFGVLGDCRIITVQKLKKAFICVFSYLLLQAGFSTQNYYKDEFYTDYASDSRFVYGLPQLVMYFLRSQFLMMLCTSVCTESGFGVYPAKTKPLPGYGPSSAFNLLKTAKTTPEVALAQEYNFSTLKCFENRKLLLSPRMKETIRCFDMPTRYWFLVYAYRHSLKTTKYLRGMFSFFVWTLWNGAALPQFLMGGTTWVYLYLEQEYTEIYDRKVGSLGAAYNVGFGIMRYLYLIYLAPCLVIQETKTLLRFYNSIYWIYHILLLILIVCALVMHKEKKFGANLHNRVST